MNRDIAPRPPESNPETSLERPLEGVPTREILEGLARLHELVFVADAAGHIVWVSDGVAALCGGADRLLGQSYTILLPRLPNPEPHAARPVRRLLCEGRTVSDVPTRIRSAAGDCEEVEASAFRVGPGAEGSGDHPLTVVVLRRVADRERADREHAHHLDFFGGILKASPDAVVAFDGAGFVTYVNPAATRLLDAKAETLVGQPLALFLPHAAGFGEIAARLEPEQALTDREVELRTKAGGSIWLSVSTRPLRSRDGGTAGSVAFLRNVTQRHRIREQLERKNSELESYVHSVSHDLRSPLVSLLGFTRLLRQDYQGLLDETGGHFLDRIEQAGRTMEVLIHDLLELSRIGQPGERPTLVDPRAVLLQLQAELKPRIEDRSVVLELPPTPPLLLCDRTRLYQIFSNLIGNALNHMGECEKPRIRVAVSEETDRHHITVADNGKGIPRSEHDRIFEVFQTVAPRADGRRSTGIGLAIVKKIAETHEGRAWVESEPGQGATFHVVLPR